MMESAWRVVADDPREPVKTTGKSNVSALDSALRAHTLHQATVWVDFATVATYQFHKVAYPEIFDMSTSPVGRVNSFCDEQFKWAEELGIKQADVNDQGQNGTFIASRHEGEGKAEVTLVVTVLSSLFYFLLSV
ncbi:hypothetical protein PM082_024915 [Marasmius tenuissimus]|nr:hypothetical protein PM082_024915 [Marasmius tenuissimus]